MSTFSGKWDIIPTIQKPTKKVLEGWLVIYKDDPEKMKFVTKAVQDYNADHPNEKIKR